MAMLLAITSSLLILLNDGRSLTGPVAEAGKSAHIIQSSVTIHSKPTLIYKESATGNTSVLR